jgi:hypothetical protein
MSSRDFAMMVAFNEIEPWVESYVGYHRTGIVAAEVWNSIQLFVSRNKRKQKKPEDFIPQWEESTYPDLAEAEDVGPAQSAVDAFFAKASAIFAALGGRKEDTD